MIGGFGPAAVNGAHAPGEWTDVDSVPVAVERPGGGTFPSWLRARNDADSLYLSLDVDQSTAFPYHFLQFSFQPRGGGTLLPERLEMTNRPGSTAPYTDGFWSVAPDGSAGSGVDVTNGGTADLRAAAGTSGTKRIFELAHPLDSADDAHDFSLAPGDTVTLSLTAHMYDSAQSSATTFSQVDVAIAEDTGVQRPGICDVNNRCIPPVRLAPGGLFLHCLERGCVVVDPLPRNCLIKFGCPGCPAGGLCPPWYRITLDGLGDDWRVELVGPGGRPFAHEVSRTATGVAVTFRPDADNFHPGRIGDYALVFRPVTDAALGREREVRAGLSIVEGRDVPRT